MKFGYLDKYERNETPVGDYHPNVHGRSHQPYAPHRQPANEYQALMECLPNEMPEMTEQEREADWNTFQERMQTANLTERELLVANCIVFGGMSLYQTAIIVAQSEGLSVAPAKMTVARCRDKAYAKLVNAFTKEPQ